MSEARIRWVGGPVLRARMDGPFHLYEAILVGAAGLRGEVISLHADELVAQVYEDTTGLRPGDLVHGSSQPLSVRLGPGLLGHIFDGLLRPLALTPASDNPSANKTTQYDFEPCVTRGQHLAGGGAFGHVPGVRRQSCLVPPQHSGTVESVGAAGRYADDAPLLVLRTDAGQRVEISLTHEWPVRRPRPAARRLPADAPLVTGQRVLDTMFPVARGGRAALPGGFGTGKTVLQQALAKWCNADVIVYVGCGERGNEMAEVLNEFPKLEDPRTGRPLLERTVIIANTSNMPVAAREASIYSAITVAEYFRDQGLHVALLADSTSRWAEALREVSGRLGELPGEAGYPAYLSSRLAEYYERAARVQTLAGAEGSVTMIGAISPPAGDFSEPVTLHTRRFVRSFWALDRQRAQARFYPAIHPLQSYAEDADTMAPWWQQHGNSDWPAQRRRLLTLLEQQAKLERMVRIVGKDALPVQQQLTLLCAELVSEAILRQSAMSPVDRYCSPERQTAMLRAVMHFVTSAEHALEAGVPLENIAALPGFRRLMRIGEEIAEGDLGRFDELRRAIDAEFQEALREAAKRMPDARAAQD